MPLALIDVMAALSQNVRMVRRIAEAYGAHAGFFGSWRLLRMVATHLLATGAVAVGDDMIGSVAGGHVARPRLAPLRRGHDQRRPDRPRRHRRDGRLPPAAVRRPAAPAVSNITGRALTGLFQKGWRGAGGAGSDATER